MFRDIINTYKSVITYIIKFIFLYMLFTFAYKLYLNSFNGETDYFTWIVAKSVNKIYHFIGLNSHIIPLNETGLKLFLNGNYIARIVEGCSGLSIIILFVVFIISFGKINKHSVFFVITGMISIFIFNILRIVLLGYILYAYPQYQNFFHKIFFPAIIYAWVVFLWVLYIKNIYANE